MNVSTKIFISVLPIFLTGCFTDRANQSRSDGRIKSNTQASQPNNKNNQSQKTTQKKQNSPIQVYERNQPYPGYHEMVRNADALAQARIQRQQELTRRQAEASQQEGERQ